MSLCFCALYAIRDLYPGRLLRAITVCVYDNLICEADWIIAGSDPLLWYRHASGFRSGSDCNTLLTASRPCWIDMRVASYMSIVELAGCECSALSVVGRYLLENKETTHVMTSLMSMNVRTNFTTPLLSVSPLFSLVLL